MGTGINKAPIVEGLESILLRITATQNPQPIGRGECIGLIFQNSLFEADQDTTNNANVYVGNSTDQIWLLIPGQESPVFYAEDLKDIYVKLLFPFPNPNGAIAVAGILSGQGGTGYTTGDVLTVLSSGGINATVEIQTVGAVTVAAIAAAGTLYTAGDVLTLSTTGGAQVTVDTVDGGGAILTFHISAPGNNAVVGVVGTAGGTGAGATFDITEVVGAAFSTVVVLTGGTMFVEGGHYETTGGTGTGAIIVVGTVTDTVPNTCNLVCLVYRQRKGGKQ